MVKRLWEWSVVQAESMAETGIVAGLLAAPLLGVVTKEDADSAVVIDMARNILGNPYEEAQSDDGDRAPGDARPRPGLRGAPGGQSLPGGGGDDGVAGVLQVGGGPPDGRANGDKKSGRGETLVARCPGLGGPDPAGSPTAVSGRTPPMVRGRPAPARRVRPLPVPRDRSGPRGEGPPPG